MKTQQNPKNYEISLNPLEIKSFIISNLSRQLNRNYNARINTFRNKSGFSFSVDGKIYFLTVEMILSDSKVCRLKISHPGKFEYNLFLYSDQSITQVRKKIAFALNLKKPESKPGKIRKTPTKSILNPQNKKIHDFSPISSGLPRILFFRALDD